MNGQLIGHYQVLEKIGAGGMGDVFRAHDERLGRDVALKLIRPSSSANHDHLRRFEQEARAAAALNHPNIVAIYDVGFQGETPYIVSELLEGETLRALLAKGPLPKRQANDYAQQIVHGLIAAHERRIVHRDLKPENLFVTHDDRVKILDFGVAKLQPEEGERSIDSMTTVTKAGAVVGTVAYMSPEQLRGKPVDHRSDIFSLGAIVYEMLSGRRAFEGETEVDTMTAVLREEPPSIDTSEIPTAFQDIVRHCLEKEPENRFQSARDLGFALETLSGTSGSREIRIPVVRTRTARSLPWALAAACGIAALALLWMQFQPPAPPPKYDRLTFEAGTIFSARFTPDGQAIVYTAAWNNQPMQLFSTVGDSLLAQPLALSDAELLAISRSNELAMVMHGTHNGNFEMQFGTLATSPMAGGSPREVLDDVRWADWDKRGDLAVVHHVADSSRLEYPIGHVIYETNGWIGDIHFSPNGDKIAFMNHPTLFEDGGAVCVIDLANGKVRTLSEGWESADGLAWQPSGQEIWFTAIEEGSNRNLMAVDLSGRRRLLLDLTSGMTLQDIASDGRILVALNTERLELAGASLNGKPEVALSWHDWNIAKDISPDNQSVLFEDASEASGSEYAVAIRKFDGGLPIRLGPGSGGALSPDGKWAIAISVKTPTTVTLLPVGQGRPRLLDTAGLTEIHTGFGRFTDDGKNIVIDAAEPGRKKRSFLLSLNGGKPKAITPEGVGGALVSPDGRSVASRNGNPIYSIDGGATRVIPGLEPSFVPTRWSSDNSSLYGYRSGELPGKIYKVNVTTGNESVVYELHPLSPAGVVTISPVIVSRDGGHFAYSYNQTLSVLYLISGVH
jgi:eukaryotic-like serine/threonine-protein kinase